MASYSTSLKMRPRDISYFRDLMALHPECRGATKGLRSHISLVELLNSSNHNFQSIATGMQLPFFCKCLYNMKGTEVLTRRYEQYASRVSRINTKALVMST